MNKLAFTYNGSGPSSMLTKLTSSQQVLLQWIALVVMTLDHFVIIFHNSSHWLHDLSRFVYPVFAYLVTYNYVFRTSNKNKYLVRLFFWACVSQPIYIWVFNLSFYKLNILFTLFFGLWIINSYGVLKTKLETYHEFVIVSFFFLLLFFLGIGVIVSYYWFGIALLITFAVYFHYPSSICLLFVAINIVLLNVMSGGLIQGLLGLLFFLIFITSDKIKDLVTIARLPSWFFYVYYPMHFLILGVIHSYYI